MQYEIEINKTTITLLMLAKKMKSNPIALFLQYEQYKENVFYFFYMFADKISSFPTIKELLKIMTDAKKYIEEGYPQWMQQYIHDSHIIIPLETTKLK